MRWFRWGDLIPAAITAAVAIGWLVMQLQAPVGAQVVVQTPTETYTLPLHDDTTRTLHSGGHTLTIVVENGAVYVREADCPDGVCVQTGRISRTSQSVACVPSGVILTITGDGDAAVDAVTR